MKKTLQLIAVATAFALVAFSCAQSSSDDSGTSAPEVMKPSELPDTGGTPPATQEAAVSLYNDSAAAIENSMKAMASIHSLKAPQIPYKAARASARTTIPVDETIQVGTDGTITDKGSYSYGSDSNMEEGQNLEPNKTYEGTSYEESDITSTITNIKVSDDKYSYTINGLVKQYSRTDTDYNLKTGANLEDLSQYTYSVGISVSVGFGASYGVYRSDGVGAKFVITCATDYSDTIKDASIFDDSAQTEFQAKLDAYINGLTATLKIYDDNDKEIFSKTMLLSEVLAMDDNATAE
jgi:hypothetical protein